MAGLLGAVLVGGIPFDVTYGRPIFEHLAAHSADAATFQASMSARVAHDAAAVVACYDFSGFGSVVDVAGGRGTLLAPVLDATPGLEGLLFDRPEVVEGVGVPAVGGDFFVEVPPGADCYVLSRVVHDWDDDDAVAILRTCRRAMPDSAILLLVEALLPERAVDSPAAIRMDLHMLAHVPGRERTAAEYAALLDAAGFVLTGTTTADPRSGLHVLTARPARRSATSPVAGRTSRAIPDAPARATAAEPVRRRGPHLLLRRDTGDLSPTRYRGGAGVRSAGEPLRRRGRDGYCGG